MCKTRFTNCLPLLVAAIAAQISMGQSYTVTDVGTLPSPRQVHATGINESNQICGWVFNTAWDHHGWYWDAGTMTHIPGYVSSYEIAFGINNLGRVTGTMMDIFVWDATGYLNITYAPGLWSYGYAINDRGNIAGSYNDTSYSIELPLVVLNGQIILLPASEGAARGINESNHAIGWRSIDWTSRTMFFWDGTLHDCGVPAGASDSMAYAINEADVIAGSFTQGAVEHAVLYDRSTATWTPLGQLETGGGSVAYGLNDQGQVVGAANVVGSSTHAFVWDSTRGMRDLNALIPAGSGWVLSEAMGINNHGAIAGSGTLNGQLRAFLLTPLACPADLVQDGRVDLHDLALLLSNFGAQAAPGDINGDGETNLADLALLLADFGATCP
jgi:probable HAF family extracellular repeat protein